MRDEMNKALSIIAMLGRLFHNLYLRLPIYIGGGCVTLVKSSGDLEGVKKEPRWGVVEVRQDVVYYTQYEKLMKVALKQMEKYCTPERYKIIETNVDYKQVPKWIWTGTSMISAGDENQRWEYLKFICVESGD